MRSRSHLSRIRCKYAHVAVTEIRRRGKPFVVVGVQACSSRIVLSVLEIMNMSVSNIFHAVRVPDLIKSCAAAFCVSRIEKRSAKVARDLRELLTLEQVMGELVKEN